MVNAAHASLYHWLRVGEPGARSRRMQVSGLPPCAEENPRPPCPSIAALCEYARHRRLPDLAFAYEALSRAHMVVATRP
jgi:hypothetical protein